MPTPPGVPIVEARGLCNASHILPRPPPKKLSASPEPTPGPRGAVFVRFNPVVRNSQNCKQINRYCRDLSAGSWL
ncbi:hypothetical protein LY76DRAFT_593892 [Colletotrichum caudatum]|nr:hypothetical protein LY76DRAFT_593892 [Colletotrichum caudatum]